MSSAISYIAVFLLSTSGGLSVEAEGESFPTYDQCMVESEAEAKSMARQWEWEREKTGRLPFFRAVEVRCEMQEVRHDRSR